jgi:hypothetical protein
MNVLTFIAIMFASVIVSVRLVVLAERKFSWRRVATAFIALAFTLFLETTFVTHSRSSACNYSPCKADCAGEVYGHRGKGCLLRRIIGQRLHDKIMYEAFYPA